jgi:RHS repeat-associated protein
MLSKNSTFAAVRRISVFLAILFLALGAVAQSVPNELNTGYPENSIFHGTEIENVQVENRNLHVNIPIWSAKGRGLNTGYSFQYNNHGYRLVTHCYTGGGGFCQDTVAADPLSPMVLKGYGPTDYQIVELGGGNVFCATGIYAWTIGGFFLREPDGTKHHFAPDPIRLNGSPGTCAGLANTSTLYADDGSGWIMQLNLNNGSIVSVTNKNGTNLTSGVVDANGNQLTWNSSTSQWTDTLGRPILANGSYYDSSGTLQSLTVTTSDGTVPTQITLPGNQGTYSFTYAPTVPTQLCQFSSADQCLESSNGGGEIASITLPTGGQISYTWGEWDEAGRKVASRTVSANGVTGTWNYHIGAPGGTIVTDPSGRDTEYFGSPTATVQYFDGAAGTSPLIKTVQIDYTSNLAVINGNNYFFSNSVPDPISLPIRVTTTWNQQNLVNKVETDWDLLAVAHGIFTWKNPIERREYDWGAGAPGPLLRRTDYQYLHLQNQAYLNANIADRPTDVKTYDGAGNLLAEIQNSYDAASPALINTNTGTCQSPSVPGHDYCNYGTGNLTRGNLTQVSQWLNTTNTWLNTTHTYDDLGNLLSTTDPLNHQTNISYADNWGGSGCVTATTTYAFPTLITNPLGHRNKTAYYPCTSLAQSKQDENDLRAGRAGTTFTYDLLNRPLVTAFPDGGQTTYSYNDSSLPMTITKTVRAAPDPDIVSSVQLDGLGRTSQTHLLDPEGDVYTKVIYDALGRPQKVYNPTRCNPPDTNCGNEPTWGFTSYAYDALSRTTDVTKQDGNVVHTDYSGNVTTVTDETLRQRRNVTDGLGRLIEVDEPGDAYAGTASGGSFSINGSLQQTQAHAATSASGTVTINGAEQSVEIDPCGGGAAPNTSGAPRATPNIIGSCPRTIYDSGTVTITVNGFQATYHYGGSNETASTVASGLATALNGSSSPVTASASGAVVTLVSNATGTGANYSLSATSSTSDPGDFGGPSFTASPSGASLTGGTNGVPAVTDAGTVTVSVGGNSATANYGNGAGQDSTAAAVASDLAGKLTSQNPPFTISASGSTLSLNWKSAGVAGNVAVTVSSSTNQPAYFSTPSFTSPGTTLAGGSDPYASGVAHPYVTRYSYDGLGNLTCAVQKATDTSAFSTCAAASATWRPRSFAYDSLSRLLTATNPESGQTSYQYDSNSNVISKIDARGVTINYNPTDSPIDALNRVTKKTYSNGDPAATYTYDQGAEGVERLTSDASGSVSSTFTYDPMGRLKIETNCLPSGCSGTSVTAVYDAAGSVTSLTYPDGRKVTIGYSAAGRATGMQFASFGGQSVNLPYYTVPQATTPSTWGYNPDGSLRSGTFGNGVQETYGHNNRLQLNAITASGSIQTWLSKTNGLYDSSSHNNGDIYSISDGLSSGRNQFYGYDSLNRVISGYQQDGRFNQTFNYDAWGNMKTSGTSNFNPNYDVTNRIQSPPNCNPVAQYCYDAAGDLLEDNNNHVYTYDGEARIKTVDSTGASYTYGGAGERARKDAGGVGTEYIYFAGMPIAERDVTSGNWSDYIFFNGRRIAKADNFENVIHAYGTRTGSGYEDAVFGFDNLLAQAGLANYVIQSGDHLYFRQKSTATGGGMGIYFTNGNCTGCNGDIVYDTEGNAIYADYYALGSWHWRKIDLTPVAGNQISTIRLVATLQIPAGSWDLYFADIALVSADGTVHPLYNGETSVSLVYGTDGMTGVGYQVLTNSNISTAQQTTLYYDDDQIGSARLVTAGGGWPVWQGTFTPFGQEVSAQISTNHYKFAGKERDSESGLDYFGARYYSNGLGRFVTPDWSQVIVPVPYADLTDPQSLNQYSYVRNIPTSRTDPNGHCTVDGEKHNALWCVGHAMGLTHSQKEEQARIDTERQWLIQNVAQNGNQVRALNGASNSQIDGIYQKWTDAIRSAMCSWTGCEVLYSPTDFRRSESGALVLYRGGSSIEPKPGEYKVDTEGNVKTTRGVSVNTDAAKVERFGGAHEIKFMPPELQVIQHGADGGHYEIVPRQPMSVGRYLELLKEIVVEGPKE